MRPRPKCDRETKVLIGVWVVFMLWTAFNIICQILFVMVPALRASITGT